MAERWWDEPELTLLAYTGDVLMAEQFAAWCQQSTANLLSVLGLSEDDINTGLTNFVHRDAEGEGEMSADHSASYIDSEGEERCTTCDKWLEPGYYDIEDHQRATEDDT
ncbi:hypothetical protein [Mycolicibacterium gilvum]|uniref:hypothetical protein n=1 Tax=Mycolicibacterium gilvum TaxID=1804 RepID=UPI0040462AEE